MSIIEKVKQIIAKSIEVAKKVWYVAKIVIVSLSTLMVLASMIGFPIAMNNISGTKAFNAVYVLYIVCIAIIFSLIDDSGNDDI